MSTGTARFRGGTDGGRGVAEGGESLAVRLRGAMSPNRAHALDLCALERGVVGTRDVQRSGCVRELVHADDDGLAAFDAELMLVGAARDLVLEERRRDGAG